MLHIRELKQPENELIKEMLFLAVFIPPGHPPVSRDILDLPQLKIYYDNWGCSDHDKAIALTVDDRIVGLVWGRLLSGEVKGFGFLDEQTPEISIAIQPAYRNQGWGSQLLAAISKAYLALGIKALSLSVDKRNPAVALYRRQGFVMVRENQGDFIMCKALSGNPF
jgi:ribosomal protein S18 acetylase RimI-like enzyme